jgi:hypothetical protein
MPGPTHINWAHLVADLLRAYEELGIPPPEWVNDLIFGPPKPPPDWPALFQQAGTPQAPSATIPGQLQLPQGPPAPDNPLEPDMWEAEFEANDPTLVLEPLDPGTGTSLFPGGVGEFVNPPGFTINPFLGAVGALLTNPSRLGDPEVKPWLVYGPGGVGPPKLENWPEYQRPAWSVPAERNPPRFINAPPTRNPQPPLDLPGWLERPLGWLGQWINGPPANQDYRPTFQERLAPVATTDSDFRGSGGDWGQPVAPRGGQSQGARRRWRKLRRGYDPFPWMHMAGDGAPVYYPANQPPGQPVHPPDFALWPQPPGSPFDLPPGNDPSPPPVPGGMDWPPDGTVPPPDVDPPPWIGPVYYQPPQAGSWGEVLSHEQGQG